MADHALYRFYDGRGHLLYVGITANPARRFSQHASGKAWWPHVRGISIEWYPTRADVERAERLAISVEQPAHNSALRRHRPKLAVVPPALPWELLARQGFPDRAEAIELFECQWTAQWWTVEGAEPTWPSPFRHPGRVYASQPADWAARVCDLLFGQGVDPDLMRESVRRAMRRNDPDGVWPDFFAM